MTEMTPNATPPRKRRMGLILGICGAVVVVLLAGGYVVWGALAANSHNNAWKAVAEKVGLVSSKTSKVALTPDRTAVTFSSTVASTCSADEDELRYQSYVKIATDALGHTPSDTILTLSGITRAWATEQCDADKKKDFDSAVSETQTSLASFLSKIGAPDSVAATSDGLRGLDGTQTDAFHTSRVGDVTMRSRYDGNNGLSVTFTRDPETFDWGAPFGR